MKWILQRDRFYLQGMAGVEVATTTRSVPLPLSLTSVHEVRPGVEQAVTGPAAVVGMEQVHGKRVEVVEEAKDAWVPACDGLVTDRPGVALVVRSADCLPLIAFDPVRRVVGAAHGGWRGVKAGIPQQLVALFLSKFQCVAGDIRVAIGPAIGPCCYEVGLEFEGRFPGHLQIREEKRFIVQAPWCSSCERELCFSYRREGAAAGRMITCAMLSSS